MADFIRAAGTLFSTAIILAFLGTTTSALAKVKITERTKYYSVSGKTGKQLFKSITRRGPKTRLVGHAIATTKIQFDVKNVRTGIVGRRCVVKNADVVLNLTYNYPRWKGSRRASTKTRKNWKKFMALVTKHEAAHGRISREFARKLDIKLQKLSGNVSNGCRDFGKWSSRSIKLAQREFNRRHIALDRRDGRAGSRIRKLQKVLVLSK